MGLFENFLTFLNYLILINSFKCVSINFYVYIRKYYVLLRPVSDFLSPGY